jgi:hypothetical protein
MAFEVGDAVWAYTTLPDTVCRGVRPVMGVLVSFYVYGGERHWHVRDETSRHGSTGEYKEQWLQHRTGTAQPDNGRDHGSGSQAERPAGEEERR